MIKKEYLQEMTYLQKICEVIDQFLKKPQPIHLHYTLDI